MMSNCYEMNEYVYVLMLVYVFVHTHVVHYYGYYIKQWFG